MFMYVLLPPTSTHGRLDSIYIYIYPPVRNQLPVAHLGTGKSLIAVWILSTNNSSKPQLWTNQPRDHETRNEVLSLAPLDTHVVASPNKNLRKKKWCPQTSPCHQRVSFDSHRATLWLPWLRPPRRASDFPTGGERSQPVEPRTTWWWPWVANVSLVT